MDFQASVRPHNPVLEKIGDELQLAVLQVYALLSSHSLSSRDLRPAERKLEVAVFTYDWIVKRMIHMEDEGVIFTLISSAIQRGLDHNFSTTLVSSNFEGILFLEKINSEWDIFCRVVDIMVEPFRRMEAGSPTGSPLFAILSGKLLSVWTAFMLTSQMKINFKDSFLNLLCHVYDMSYEEIVVPRMIKAMWGSSQLLLSLGVHLYEQFFERVFLEHAGRFYADYSRRFLDARDNALSRLQKDNTRPQLSLSDRVSLYLQKVEMCLENDTARVAQFLPLETRSKFLNILQTNMIQKHLDTLLDELPNMLWWDKREDLKRMCDLLAGLPGSDCLQRMCHIVSTHVLEEGRDILDEENDPLGYVQTLLLLTSKYEKLSAESFQHEIILQEAVVAALRRVIGWNTSAPEFVSLFLDDQLRKNFDNLFRAKTDEFLDRMVGVLCYVDQKDQFLWHYAKHWQIRVLSGCAGSEDAERKVVTKLAKLGFEYFAGMLQDIQTSKGLTRNSTFRLAADVNCPKSSVQDFQGRLRSGVAGESSAMTDIYIPGLKETNVGDQQTLQTVESDIPHHFESMGFIGQSSNGPGTQTGPWEEVI